MQIPLNWRVLYVNTSVDQRPGVEWRDDLSETETLHKMPKK